MKMRIFARIIFFIVYVEISNETLLIVAVLLSLGKSNSQS